MRAAVLLVCLTPLAPACDGATTPTPVLAKLLDEALQPDMIPLAVDLSCPGDARCPDEGDGLLYAATARRDITPLVEPFTDLNGNGVHDDGEPFVDRNGNGVFDAVWLAGYGSGRQAFGVHDPTWVRCYVLRQNKTTLAHCVVDSVGWFQNEQEQVRADLDPKLGVTLLMMGATHLHETQDTIGIWGPDAGSTGRDDAYNQRIRQLTLDAIAEAVRKLVPAKMSIGSILVEDPGHDLTPYVSDSRDPVVIDNRMHVMQFDAASDGRPIVTVLNWASHPESLGPNNRYVTSDYLLYLRGGLERHTGSDVVFVNGDLGGQIGPNHVSPRGDDGKPIPVDDHSFRYAAAWGGGLADFAMKAFDARTPVAAPKLGFQHTTINVHVDNLVYQTGYNLGVYDRPVFGYDPRKPRLRDENGDNIPLVVTEAAYLRIGPAAIATAPGELLPENFLGGYHGELAGTYPFFDPKRPNPPDVTKAPAPPYLFDLMGGTPEHRMVFGLTLDFLGYFIPRYNFVLDKQGPYYTDAPGDHYEETNSIGPRAEPEIVGTMRQLAISAKDEPWSK